MDVYLSRLKKYAFPGGLQIFIALIDRSFLANHWDVVAPILAYLLIVFYPQFIAWTLKQPTVGLRLFYYFGYVLFWLTVCVALAAFHLDHPYGDIPRTIMLAYIIYAWHLNRPDDDEKKLKDANDALVKNLLEKVARVWGPEAVPAPSRA